ncbi:CDP-glycerol glycerophosphotransferase family protein [Alloiococcus sp. CFN-8]|uniref:CDP-glycerol glycerophosphotransferase family protein n=1 Tax=Alloiococcus sp. CFN-8 TaxID=3416081 RepID=UPI003CF6D656
MKARYSEKRKVVIKKYLTLMDGEEEFTIDVTEIRNCKPNKRMIIKKNYSLDTNSIIKVLDLGGVEAYLFIDEYGNLSLSRNNPREGFYNKKVSVRNHIFSIKHKGNSFVIYGVMLFRHWKYRLSEEELYFQAGDVKIPLQWRGIRFRGKLKGAQSFLSLYKAVIPAEALMNLEIHTPLLVGYEDQEGYELKKPIRYKIYHGGKGRYLSSKVITLKEKNTSLYLRQSVGNTVYITNRPINVTDYQEERKKLALSYYLAKLLPKKGVIMYEKEASKFEESASIVFQELVRRGCRDVFFVIDKNSSTRDRIPKDCEPYVIDKYSLKHYMLFFRAKAFVGTETPAHSLELRSSSRYVVKRLKDKSLSFVFLQHGVMYMVSLASAARKDARKGGLYPPNTRIVVSSKKEAEHFIEEGNYLPEDLYITGLPKFDEAVRHKGARRIVLMPTWRPWDYNLARVAPEESGYYRFVSSIAERIPEEYKEDFIILPHPLIKDAFVNTTLERYVTTGASYDDILKETDILITDYSSIAYDAFNRGAKVIFCWEEMECCMRQYRGYLKLNEENVFGDVSRSYEDIPELIRGNYLLPQKPEYLERFKALVEYNDGNNTARVIDALSKDKIVRIPKKH